MLAALLGLSVVSGCEGRFSVLDPASPQAALVADLWWLMLVLSTAITVLVVALLAWALWRRPDGDRRPRLNPMALVVGGGILLPLAVLPILWVVSLQAMAAVSAPAQPSGLEIEIRGRQWSYDVFYPQSGIRLVDEVRIPVGEPVLLRLESEDVIHSFWVPRLGGKTDLVPGVTNETWIQASAPGTYEGRCAEFCGIGHFEMSITVTAQERADFEAWLRQATP